jgi:hypothetical protein
VTEGVLLSADSFNRADGAVGSTNGAGPLDPLAWTTHAGTFVIASNQLAATALGLDGATMTCDLGTGNVDITYTHVALDVNGQGIICRYTDLSNFIYLNGDNTQLRLQKYVAGASSNISGTLTTSLLAGTVVRLWAQDNLYIIYLDGVEVGSAVDTFNMTATRHGLRHQGTSQRSDNWSVLTS